jgi:hypothetical protein
MDDVFQGDNLTPIIREFEGTIKDDNFIICGNNHLLKAHFFNVALKHNNEKRTFRPIKIERRKNPESVNETPESVSGDGAGDKPNETPPPDTLTGSVGSPETKPPDPTAGVADTPADSIVIKRLLFASRLLTKGDDVDAVHVALIEKGLHVGQDSVQGIYGAKTAVAVRHFRSKNRLIVDGKVGKFTAAALGFVWEG